MIGIDTNVLVRILVDDKGALEQCQKARALIRQHDKVFIPLAIENTPFRARIFSPIAAL